MNAEVFTCAVCHHRYYDSMGGYAAAPEKILGQRCWMYDEVGDGWTERCRGTIGRSTMLDEVVREYLSFMGKEAADPEEVHDQCHRYSRDFISFVEGYAPELEPELVYGFKLMEFMGQKVIGNAHVAVRMGESVYDWTYRQFDPDCPVPRITTVEEFRAEWPLLA